jgi:hypothetical protein
VSRDHATLVAAILAVGAAGCAQLFGFDETEPYDDNGLRLSWHKKRVGATVVDEAMDLSAASTTFLVADPAEPSGLRQVPGVLEDSDTFFADIPSGTYAAMLTRVSEDSVWRIYAFPVRGVGALYGLLGHPGPEPAPPNAQLDLGVTLDVAYTAESLMLYDVGAWSYRGFPELPAAGATAWDPPAVAYSTFASATGGPLVRMRSSDAVAVLRYVGPALSGYGAVTPFDQQDGVDLITTTLATVPLDRVLDATFFTMVAGPRFAATTPAVAGISQSWYVNASPGTAIATNTGPTLTSGGLLETDTGLISTMFGNPFPWDTTITFSTSETRTYLPTGATNPTGLAAGLYTVDLHTAGTPQTFDLPQGLPLLVTVDGRALTADGAVLQLDRTRGVEVSIVTDREACDVYGLNLYELVDNGAGTFVPVIRGALLGSTAQFLIPGDLFETDRPYVFRAMCQLGGLPGLATGDLVTRQWPVHVGYFDGGVFQVSP